MARLMKHRQDPSQIRTSTPRLEWPTRCIEERAFDLARDHYVTKRQSIETV